MTEEDCKGMIPSLSVLTEKTESYFKDMEERRLVDEYDRLLQID